MTKGTSQNDPFSYLVWCRGWDLNPQVPCGTADFKSAAFANFATPARIYDGQKLVRIIDELSIICRCSVNLLTPGQTSSAART